MRPRGGPTAWLALVLAVPERKRSRWLLSGIVAAMVLVIGVFDYMTAAPPSWARVSRLKLRRKMAR
jgi:hypothetical protein